MYRLRFQHSITGQFFEEEYSSVMALLYREEKLSEVTFAGLVQYNNFSMTKV